MRAKLQKFTDFSNTLLPHETAYLLSVEEFQDPVRLEILKQIDHNCRNIHQFTPYDTSIDKRKYSNLKNWIQSRLQDIDVDEQFLWMSRMEQHIMTDALQPDEEKDLLKAIRQFEKPYFFFTKFYELVRAYRHFILVRLRYADHELVSDFLKRYEADYKRSLEVNDQIHRATLDIVKQYSGQPTESIQWESWLTEIFYEEDLDGLNRYMALVRLTFVYLNYRHFDRLLDKYDYLDGLFKKGVYYSKRLLLNYYGNRLLLHTKFQEFDKAEYYGYLSTRGKNNDYLHYINNLAAVLLRQGKHQEANQVMREALSEMKVSQSFFNKIGFVSFYVKSLIRTGQYKSAENYAESFLRAYRKEIMEYRWHNFFAAYLEVLLVQKKYDKILKVTSKHKLMERDEKYQNKATYVPDVRWYQAVAAYKSAGLLAKELKETLQRFSAPLMEEEEKHHLLTELYRQLKNHIPDLIHQLEYDLHARGILL